MLRSEPNHSSISGFQMLALLLGIPFLRLLWLADLRNHIVETVTLLLASSIFYLLSVRLVLQSNPIGDNPFGIKKILLAGLLFRVTVFPLYPAFTDDLHRYRWEGKIQEAGFNPYLHAPKAVELEPLRDALYPRIDGKDFPAVYGPLLELEQRAVYRILARITPVVSRQLFWFKAPAALAELGVMGVVLMLLRARGRPLEHVLIYAWCPLPIFEFWATGHNDSLVLLPLLLAVALRPRWTAVFLSLATAAKFWPALLIPSLVDFRRRQILAFGAIFCVILVLFFAPYAANLTQNAQFATGFLGGWRNNDSLHALIAGAAGDPYRAKYITMGLIGAAALGVGLTRWRAEARVLAVIVTILALSANVHPWYLTWMIPLLALYPIPGLLLWTSLAPLAYGALIEWTILGAWNGLSPLRWLVYAPVAAVLAWDLSRLSSRRRS